uniref:E3 ubiquitin/ISG15 ligase TRIM25-like n=1 Tax=Leptobrachium leishanense TaxID=445787 RepID=A0A8C5QXY6_9ANUR
MSNAKDLLAEDLLCPICLCTYTEPVSLSCGHSFCKKCINQVLAHQQKGKHYSCPVCQVEYKQLPELMKNFPLCSIVESFNSLEIKKPVEGSISCNYCLDDQSVAVKTCITCEVSLCQQHLDRHTNRSHVMVEPTLSMADRKCPVHDKLIEFYCETDRSTVCVTCYIAGSHKGHSILTLKEAHSKHNGVLTQAISALQDSEVGLHRDRDELQKALRKVKENSEKLSAPLKDLKANIISQVQDQWQNILDAILCSEHQVTSTIENLTKQMKEKQTEAMRTIQELEMLKYQSDDLLFVKRFQTVQDQIKKQNLKVDTLQVLDVKIDQSTVQAIEYRTVCYISEINQILQQVQSSVTTQTRNVVRSVDDKTKMYLA